MYPEGVLGLNAAKPVDELSQWRQFYPGMVASVLHTQ